MRLSNEEAGEILGQSQAHIRALTLAEASQRAAQNMMSEYRELIATLPVNWPQRCVAWLRLNGPSGDDAIRDGNIWLLESWMQQALLSLIDADMTPEIVTPESLADLARLRKDCAIRSVVPQEEMESVAAEPAGPTEADLDAAVINDWQTLPTSVVRAKCRDANYKARLDRLMAEGKI